MAKTEAISVAEYYAGFIERQVTQGRYASASDVVQSGLRLLEEREAKLEALRAALIEAEESGPCTPFDFDEFLERKHQQHAEKK